MLEMEIKEQHVLGTVLPSIFLGVAAFLLNVVVSRLVATQREQIAALKALGYANRTIGAHYLKLVLVIVIAGMALGVTFFHAAPSSRVTCTNPSSVEAQISPARCGDSTTQAQVA